jgi:hypothetical protein
MFAIGSTIANTVAWLGAFVAQHQHAVLIMAPFVALAVAIAFVGFLTGVGLFGSYHDA